MSTKKLNNNSRIRRLFVLGLPLVLAFSFVACSDGDTGGTGGTGGSGGGSELPQCNATAYLAFDSANHANQDIRVAAITKMIGWLNEAKTDYTLAKDRFTKAKELYENADDTANLRAKVQGRTNDHLDGNPVRGDYIDATIMKWLNAGIAATTNLEANIAKQMVDKTFTEFFFQSVYHEMVDGSRSHWDEAFGYYGTKSDNDETEHEAFAVTAFKRDATNGTNLNAEIFNNLIDGSCALGKALSAAGKEEIDWKSDTAVSAAITDVDMAMQKILAFSTGHEAFEMQEAFDNSFDITNSEHTDEVWIKMAELVPFFVAIEPILLAKGGDSESAAKEIRAFVDMVDFEKLDEVEWMTTFATDDATTGKSAPQRIIQLLEAEYSIDIKG